MGRTGITHLQHCMAFLMTLAAHTRTVNKYVTLAHMGTNKELAREEGGEERGGEEERREEERRKEEGGGRRRGRKTHCFLAGTPVGQTLQDSCSRAGEHSPHILWCGLQYTKERRSHKSWSGGTLG